MQINLDLISIVPALGLLGSALFCAVRFYVKYHHLRRDVSDLRHLNSKLRQELDAVSPIAEAFPITDPATTIEELKKVQAEKDRIIALGNQVVAAYRSLQKDFSKQRDELRRLEGEKKTAEESQSHLGDKILALETQIDGMKTQDGRLWQRRVADSAPAFRPRSDRGFPIISILNLKGGVGKTTITAHLAGALGQKGRRVLMVDLDYQRSLSMMLVPVEQRKILHLEKHCLQHFFRGAQHGPNKVLECQHAIAGMKNCSIITNSDARPQVAPGDPRPLIAPSDSLEETESQMMAEWLVKRDAADVRLFLREGLHGPELTRKFDYVLLDCPPRLTTACINALAASDYVLIPVVLDALSARALPELLSFLSRLKDNLLSNLSILGVVANLATLRVGKLVEQESAVWADLSDGLEKVWKGSIPIFKTAIPDKSIFGLAAGSIDSGTLKLALSDDAVQKTFNHLIAEIEKELKSHDSRHTSAVLA